MKKNKHNQVDSDIDNGELEEDCVSEDEKIIDKPSKEDSPSRRSKKGTAIILCISSLIVIAAVIVCGKYIYELYKYYSAGVPEETVLEYTGQEYSIDDIDFVTGTGFEYTVEGEYHTMTYRGQYVYDVTLELKNAWFIKSRDYYVVVNVEDTTPPSFDIDSPTAITITKDCRLGSLKRYFAVTDMTKVTLSIDEGTYDLSTIGRYPTKVIATDEEGNESSLDITINVVSPKVTIKETNCTLKVGQTIKLTPEVTGKEKTVTWTSDDPSIATVDENGNVRGISEGTTKITVSANGVENSIACFVN